MKSMTLWAFSVILTLVFGYFLLSVSVEISDLILLFVLIVMIAAILIPGIMMKSKIIWVPLVICTLFPALFFASLFAFGSAVPVASIRLFAIFGMFALLLMLVQLVSSLKFFLNSRKVEGLMVLGAIGIESLLVLASTGALGSMW